MNDNELIIALSQPCDPESLRPRHRGPETPNESLLRRVAHASHRRTSWVSKPQRGKRWVYENAPLWSPAFFAALALPSRRVWRIIDSLIAINKLAQ